MRINYEVNIYENILLSIVVDGVVPSKGKYEIYTEYDGMAVDVEDSRFTNYRCVDPDAPLSLTIKENNGWTIHTETYMPIVFVNKTPHNIVVNDGSVYEPVLPAARVSNKHTAFVGGICDVLYGQVENLPEPKKGVRYIVSAMVLAAAKDRKDLVAPATGHPLCIRKEGRIISVPGFVRNL